MPVTAVQITQAAQDHEVEGAYGQLPNGDTPCNFFVRDIAKGLPNVGLEAVPDPTTQETARSTANTLPCVTADGTLAPITLTGDVSPALAHVLSRGGRHAVGCAPSGSTSTRLRRTASAPRAREPVVRG